MEQEHPTTEPLASVPPVSPDTAESPDDGKPVQRVPARYNLYSRLNVSLRTMDIIIAVIVILIIAALAVGIFWK